MNAIEALIGIEGTRLAKAIQIGKIWIDIRHLEKTLHRYVKHIFALNANEQFPYSFPGSGSTVRVANRHFLFCCGHQIGTWRADEIAFCIYGTQVIISSSGMLHPIVVEQNSDTDYIDARAFQFETDNYDHNNLGSEFFPADPLRVWPQNSIGLPFLVYGYPSHLQDVDYSVPKIAARAIELKATYDGITSSPHLHRIRMKQNKQFDPDGMSGGPVFYIGRENGSLFIGWAGMVMRGGNSSDTLHFLAADFLVEMAINLPISEVRRLG